MPLQARLGALIYTTKQSLALQGKPVNIFLDFKLDGKVAFVTGASSRLDVAFARSLADSGAAVALGARRTERLAVLGSDIERSGRRAVVPADGADPADCSRLSMCTSSEPSVTASLLSHGQRCPDGSVGSGTRRTREEIGPGMLAAEGRVPC